jgi:hypothetical protein
MKSFSLKALMIIIVLSVIPVNAMARDTFSFGIQANSNAVEFLGEAGILLKPSTFYAGGNGIYFEDKYSMLGVHGMVGNLISPGLTGKVGFKGVTGKFKRPRHDDSNLLAIGFSVSGRYNLAEVIATHYVPLILHATVTVSPKPLSFNETNRFFEGILGVDWMFLENAAVTASFRYLDVGFDLWDRTHGSGYGGLKFIF